MVVLSTGNAEGIHFLLLPVLKIKQNIVKRTSADREWKQKNKTKYNVLKGK